VTQPSVAGAWTAHQLTFAAERPWASPYTDLDLWVDFTHEDGTVLRRPGFWDGGNAFGVRFTAAGRPGRWTWRSHCTEADPGLDGRTGSLEVTGRAPEGNRFRAHGFWRMSPGGRSLVHADGHPAVLVADTAWALPWRATPEQARRYAADRQAKGFNAALLMSVQPDMKASGPRDRTADGGFDVAFEDLADGHLNQLNPGYFRALDAIAGILAEHEIVPVLQPVFMGFGWKGLQVAGPVVPPAEYARYCRYLVARYGAQPVVYLVGADGTGCEPQVEAGGREVHEWDCYRQPAGIHYRPHSTAAAHQDAAWLDFQWCQTGHEGEHVPERVALLWARSPAKAAANGEPTYENSGRTGKASGWWQGHEAWSNLCAGGTMGVVYGAGSLWQWALRPDEPGQEPYFLAPGCGWREALDFEGSRYVGMLGRILDGLPTTDMRPDWESVIAPRGLTVPGELHILYLEGRRRLRVTDAAALPRCYTAIDPRDGTILSQGETGQFQGTRPGTIETPGGGPCVIVFTKEPLARGERS
jgi:uncharacterized protein DUF4038/uncharacterized protein DUF5060